MGQKTSTRFSGWEISFSPNVHMYCHALAATKGEYRLNLPCEDLPTKEKTIGIWLHDLDISAKHKEELQVVLLKWANSVEVKCKVFITNDEFVSNGSIA